MIIIGCDYHPGFQQIAWLDTQTGELEERRLGHREQAEHVQLYWMWRRGWGLRRNAEARFARGRARTSPWCAVNHRRNDWASHSPSKGSSKYRGCDRRDGWVGLRSWPERLAASPRLAWQISTGAKWRSSRSTGCSGIESPLTPPTLLELGMFRQLPHSSKCRRIRQRKI